MARPRNVSVDLLSLDAGSVNRRLALRGGRIPAERATRPRPRRRPCPLDTAAPELARR
ncbi:hypothetical protein [Micromonospora foliorum]|uniref:hypothetical protein n=1 Tax=Micromonospora foliorum TaxID=2911210 RepID=UPI001EE8246F|nr:hypothetical protein [Micromonospora foliorum]MCG5436258.1 hypothetical protein [Micromonospora foliorum]